MSSNNKILIIEDNPMNLDMAKALLNVNGFQTYEAEDGETGLRLAKEIRPTLILLDLNLPMMDGYEVLQQLRANPETRDIRAVAFTALAMEEDRKRTSACGFNGIITKPINVDSFAMQVKAFCMASTLAEGNGDMRAGQSPSAPEAVPPLEPGALLRQSPEPETDFRILVVDDEPSNVVLLQELLTRLGYEVNSASSGAAALEAVSRSKPDLVLLDIRMPGEFSGYDVLDRLQRNPETADILVVFVSALDEIEALSEGLRRGACDYLTKPLRLEEVKARVSAAARTKKLQDELRQKAIEAENARQDLEQFLFIASHDLQAPLRKIQQFQQFLEATGVSRLSSEAKEYLDGIHRNTSLMENLLAALLTLSRIERRGAPMVRMDLNAMIEQLIHRRYSSEQAAGRVRLSLNPLPACVGDQDQLVQAIEILLDNAVKFRKADAPLRIDVSTKPEGLCGCRIAVQDRGIGFDQKYAERIFRPLERLNGAHKYPGVGMGLAILHKIAKRHKGSVEVSSQPGEGSVFSLILPA